MCFGIWFLPKWGLLAQDRDRCPQPGEVCLFYRDVFVGLRWGSVREAMLVYCDDAFDLRRLFKSFRTQIYLTRWNVF